MYFGFGIWDYLCIAQPSTSGYNRKQDQRRFSGHSMFQITHACVKCTALYSGIEGWMLLRDGLLRGRIVLWSGWWREIGWWRESGWEVGGIEERVGLRIRMGSRSG